MNTNQKPINVSKGMLFAVILCTMGAFGGGNLIPLSTNSPRTTFSSRSLRLLVNDPQLGAVNRTYIVAGPTPATVKGKIPVVFDFHWQGGSGSGDERAHSYDKLAEKSGWVDDWSEGPGFLAWTYGAVHKMMNDVTKDTVGEYN